MSNSTRPGGYDERLVVPLEASRRGAHRARTNPLVAALPLLAVVVVVAAVIGVAYALFLRPGGNQTAADPLTTPTPPAATGGATTPATPGASMSPSTSPSSPGASSTPPSAAPVKTAPVLVYNGTLNNGTRVDGLARTATNQLTAAGFSKADFTTAPWTASSISQTTVFYGKDDLAATAQALVKALGVGKAQKSSAVRTGLAVVAYSDIQR